MLISCGSDFRAGKSIGGFRVIPDYSFDTMPEGYAALVLIGGFGWTAPVAEKSHRLSVRPLRQASGRCDM